MVQLFHRSSRQPGSPPGTLHAPGDDDSFPTRIRIIDYDEDSIAEHPVEQVPECIALRDTPTTTWIDFTGLADIDALRELCEGFDIHPLVQEDIVHTHQRPKVEEHGSYLYVVLHMLSVDEDRSSIQSEQISLILHGNTVLSFQEKPGDVFEGVRERLRVGKGRIRGWGADYLLYALIDAVVDHYFLILEWMGDLIEDLEIDLLADPRPQQLSRVHAYKREMILMRRAIWPLREVIAHVERIESPLLAERIGPFLRDVYDHTVQVAEAVETFRDMLSGLQDLYLSSISNKMNEVMKVLTIAATFFVPLTFIAGVYGMNFEFMPELHWRWSYPVFWLVSLLVGGGLFVFFKRRNYL